MYGGDGGGGGRQRVRLSLVLLDRPRRPPSVLQRELQPFRNIIPRPVSHSRLPSLSLYGLSHLVWAGLLPIEVTLRVNRQKAFSCSCAVSARLIALTTN